MSILLEVRCKRHPRYNAVQYPRRLPMNRVDGVRCQTCVQLWRLRRGLHESITTVTAGSNP